jgi:hypothetical protein
MSQSLTLVQDGVQSVNMAPFLLVDLSLTSLPPYHLRFVYSKQYPPISTPLPSVLSHRESTFTCPFFRGEADLSMRFSVNLSGVGLPSVYVRRRGTYGTGS